MIISRTFKLSVAAIYVNSAASFSLSPIEIAPGVNGLVGGPLGGPAVVVIQEWWGITDEIKEHAKRISKAGNYRVLIPDLYKGKIGVDAEEASHLMSNLDFPAAVNEISAAAKYLKSEGNNVKVGVVGFCMGGALALGALAKSSDLACGVTFYGVNFDLFDPKELAKKPVQGHFGELDAMAGFSDPATAALLEKRLREAKSDNGPNMHHVYTYPTVGHAFMNRVSHPFQSFEERKEKVGFPPYDQQQESLASHHLEHFLRRHLGNNRNNNNEF